MLKNLSSLQKAVGGVVVIAGVVGWIFASSKVSEIDGLKSDLEAAQGAQSELQQRVEATGSLKELTAALEAGEARQQTLQSEIEGSQAELETLRTSVQRQRALLEGSMPKFKTKSRAKVRAGPGTDTDEVAVVHGPLASLSNPSANARMIKPTTPSAKSTPVTHNALRYRLPVLTWLARKSSENSAAVGSAGMCPLLCAMPTISCVSVHLFQVGDIRICPQGLQ